MSAVNAINLSLKAVTKSSNFVTWLPIVIGLFALYFPTYQTAFQQLWVQQDQAHGPIVLMVVLFLFWQKRRFFSIKSTQQASPVLGSMVLTLGLLCYVAGRSQDIFILDLGSQILVFAGIFLFIQGFPLLKAMWFPLFFIIFMLPFPLDSITLPMKMAVSYVQKMFYSGLDTPLRVRVLFYKLGNTNYL